MALFVIWFFFVLGIIFLIGWIIEENRFCKQMVEQGYERQFVITCSADEGSWQWVKRETKDETRKDVR